MNEALNPQLPVTQNDRNDRHVYLTNIQCMLIASSVLNRHDTNVTATGRRIREK